MQNILMVIGIIVLLIFLLPIKKGSILNIGNKTGITVGSLLVIGGMFLEDIQKFMQENMSSGSGAIIVYCATFIASFIIVAALLETIFMIKAVFKRTKENGTVIILGCKVNGDKPSRTLESRLKAAEKYLKKHPDVSCIVSGGQGEDEMISEALCMYRYLIENGIEKERIYLEDKSTTTKENLIFSREIIRKNSLPEQLILVTSEYHQCRAGIEAGRLGFSYGSVSGRTPWWLLPTFYVRELYAILAALIIK